MLSEPVALAPEAGREQVVGEVSAAAEAFGVTPGMRVGEALARCPELRLAPPDPEGVRALWCEVLDRLESIGAAVESDQPGCAYFEAEGLHGIHGGHLEGVLAATRRVLGRGIRLGAGPSRFTAYAAARRARPRRAEVVGAGRCPGVARAAAGLASPRPARARPVVGNARAARHPHARRAVRRCRRRRSPSASATRACLRSTWRAVATLRSSRGARPSPSSSGSSFRRRRSASSSSARSSCSWRACSRVPSGVGARCARPRCPRASWRAAPGARV